LALFCKSGWRRCRSAAGNHLAKSRGFGADEAGVLRLHEGQVAFEVVITRCSGEQLPAVAGGQRAQQLAILSEAGTGFDGSTGEEFGAPGAFGLQNPQLSGGAFEQAVGFGTGAGDCGAKVGGAIEFVEGVRVVSGAKVEPPAGAENFVGLHFLECRSGSELGEQGLAEPVEKGLVFRLDAGVARKQIQRGCIAGDGSFAFGSAGAGRAQGVAAIGGDLGGGGHEVCSWRRV
jgi:hypothetical protein